MRSLFSLDECMLKHRQFVASAAYRQRDPSSLAPGTLVIEHMFA